MNYPQILLSCLSLLFSLSSFAGAVRFSDRISELWMRGDKGEVVRIAEDRLDRDEDDLMALLLKLDYEVAFLKLEDLRMTIPRVEKRADSVTSPQFEKMKGLLRANLTALKEMIPQITKEIVEAERPKGDIVGKPMPSLEIIRALEADGEDSELRNDSEVPERQKAAVASERPGGVWLWLVPVGIGLAFFARWFWTRRG